MNILIVGGAGYIGSHVAWAFLDRGDKVTIYDDFSSGSRRNIPKEAQVERGNILNQEQLQEVVKRGWDGVVHLAAFKAAGESMEKPEKYAVNNITGTVNLLNALTAANAPPLVFSSSAAVFGEPQYLPLDENHPKKPENFYGYTKLSIESLLAWYHQLKGLPSASLRYFNAAGYDLQGRVTEPEKNPANLLPLIMETAAGTRKELTVFGDDYPTPDGTCIRDYIHAADLAEAHLRALDRIAASRECLEINLGSEKGISVAEMIKTAQDLLPLEFSYQIGPRRLGDPANLVASSARARELLDWSPRFSDVETLIRSTWEVYKG